MAITRIGGANAITGTIPTSVAPGAAKVLQVVSTTKTDVFSLSGTTTKTDVTGLSVSITPSSTSNKILLSVYLTCQNLYLFQAHIYQNCLANLQYLITKQTNN